MMPALPRRLLFAAPALLLATSVRAVTLNETALTQGGFVLGRAAPGTRLALDGRAVRVSPAGHFAFGFGRDHAAQARLVISPPGGAAETRVLNIAKRQWPTESISGLPPAQVTPDAETLTRIAREREKLAAVRAIETNLTGFAEGFIRPAPGRISGVFGSQRILNGQPRQPHYGLDFAAPTGTPVLACAGGRVTLADAFHFFGKLIVLDHGHGVNSLYAHLSEISVREGETIAKAQRIGAIGMTGRVTGPHLHFSLSWFLQWLDPQPVVLPA